MVWRPSQDDCGIQIRYWFLMGLSSSCWLCLHMSNAWPHQNLSALSPLNTFRWKQLNHVCQQSSLNCQCQPAWLRKIQCSQCLQTCSCPLVLPCTTILWLLPPLSSVGNHWKWRSLGFLWTCAESTGSLGICMKLVVQGLPHFYPVFLITLPFQGAAPLPGCIRSLLISPLCTRFHTHLALTHQLRCAQLGLHFVHKG
jgi:hypothetical protein